MQSRGGGGGMDVCMYISQSVGFRGRFERERDSVSLFRGFFRMREGIVVVTAGNGRISV